MPDDELLQLAKDSGLQNDETLEAQVRRMLTDRRSIELAESFYIQWLRLPELWSAQPDKKLFPGFYSDINDKRTLAQDMFGEALLLFQTILVEDRPVTELLDSDYTFINGKLAQLYDRSHEQLQKFSDGTNVSVLDLEEDRVWSRVRTFDPQRGGIITSPAVLTLTSFPPSNRVRFAAGSGFSTRCSTAILRLPRWRSLTSMSRRIRNISHFVRRLSCIEPSLHVRPVMTVLTLRDSH